MVFRRHLQLPRLASVQRDEQRPNGRLGRHRRHNRRRFRRRGRVPVPVPVLLLLPQEGPCRDSPPTKAHNRGPRAPARCRDENKSDESGESESDERLSPEGLEERCHQGARGRRLRRRRWRRQLLSLLGRWRRQLLSTARVQVRWSLRCCATNHQPLHGSGCARRMASFETGDLRFAVNFPRHV